jgi:hypothetical protein
MIGMVLVTHGRLAAEFVEALELSSGDKAGRPARITPRVLQRVSGPRHQRRSLAMASKAKL